jgi:uncharacterized protein YjbI with pentapeptide repeats
MSVITIHPKQDREPPVISQAGGYMAQYIASINESAKNARSALIFLLVLSALMFSFVLAADHAALLFENAAPMPLLGVNVPLIPSFILIPPALLFVHAALLVQIRALNHKMGLYREVYEKGERREQDGNRPAWSREALLFPFAYMLGTPGFMRNHYRLARALSVLGIYVIPPVALGVALVRFLPYQSYWITFVHQLALAIDIGLCLSIRKSSAGWTFIFDSTDAPSGRANSLAGTARKLASSPRFLMFLAVGAIVFHQFRIPVGAENPNRPGSPVRMLLWNVLDPLCGLDVDGFFCRHFIIRNELLVEQQTPDVIVAAYIREGKRPANEDDLLHAHAKGLSLAKRRLRFADFSDSRLFKADLRGADMEGALLGRAKLQGADFTDARLAYANLRYADASDASFRNADMAHANLWAAKLDRAVLAFAAMERANLSLASLNGADLSSAVLRDAEMIEAKLHKADLFRTDLSGANLWAADMREAKLLLAKLKEAKLVNAKLQGADLGEARLERANLMRAQMQGAYLWSAKMQGANLTEAQLLGAYLIAADLRGANAEGANFQAVDLSGAQLQGANFTDAQLQGAGLYQADLSGASFVRARMEGANLEGANMIAAMFYEADLRSAALRAVRRSVRNRDEQEEGQGGQSRDEPKPGWQFADFRRAQGGRWEIPDDAFEQLLRQFRTIQDEKWRSNAEIDMKHARERTPDLAAPARDAAPNDYSPVLSDWPAAPAETALWVGEWPINSFKEYKQGLPAALQEQACADADVGAGIVRNLAYAARALPVNLYLPALERFKALSDNPGDACPGLAGLSKAGREELEQAIKLANRRLR